MSEPRVWTLETDEYAEGKRDWMVGKQEPPIEKPERVRVIELEPVLDLLERLLEGSVRLTTQMPLYAEAEVLLRSHRRLREQPQ